MPKWQSRPCEFGSPGAGSFNINTSVAAAAASAAPFFATIFMVIATAAAAEAAAGPAPEASVFISLHFVSFILI